MLSQVVAVLVVLAIAVISMTPFLRSRALDIVRAAVKEPITTLPAPTCDEILRGTLCELSVTKDSVTVRGEQLHYWVYERTNSSTSSSTNNKLPIVMINGGPGFPHNYLLPLKQSACEGRKVVFYDQVGTGLSSVCPPVKPGENPNACALDDAHQYLLDRKYYVDEVAALVQVLGLHRTGYHLLGHSWGTIVATMFAAKKRAGLRSIVLAGAIANAKDYIAAQWDEKEGNLGTLPDAMKKLIKKIEAEKGFQTEVYKQINEMLTTHFTVRTFPAPDCWTHCLDFMNEEVYVRMQGPTEFAITDALLEDLNLYPDLRRITVPVLLTNGKFDTMRPPNVRKIADELTRVERLIFERSGHSTMIDEPVESNRQMTKWWTRIEKENVQ